MKAVMLEVLGSIPAFKALLSPTGRTGEGGSGTSSDRSRGGSAVAGGERYQRVLDVAINVSMLVRKKGL